MAGYWTTGVTRQVHTTSATGQMKKKTATQSAEAPGVSTEMQPTSQDATYSVASRSEVQPPDPNGQPVPALKKQAISFAATTAPSDKVGASCT